LRNPLQKADPQDIKTPPEYEVASWNLKEKKLVVLSKINGSWLPPMPGIPKGGGKYRREPFLKIGWLPPPPEAAPHRSGPPFKTYEVDPTTLEIVK